MLIGRGLVLYFALYLVGGYLMYASIFVSIAVRDLQRGGVVLSGRRGGGSLELRRTDYCGLHLLVRGTMLELGHP